MEVVKGPSSVLYGQGGAGGVVNMTTKKPLATPLRQVVASYGTNDRKQLQFDISQPFHDNKVAVRLNGMYRDSDTQVDFIKDDRQFIAGALAIRPTPMTEVTLLAMFQDDHTGSTTQFLPHQGTIFANPNGRLPSNLLVSEPSVERYDNEQTSVSGFIRHSFTDNIEYRMNARVVWTDTDYYTIYPNSYAAPRDPWVKPGQPGYAGPMRSIPRTGSLSEPKARIYTMDNQLQATFATGAAMHTFLAGYDMQAYKDKRRSVSLAGLLPPIDLYAPVYNPDFVLPATAPANTTGQDQMGVYAQDQVKIGGLNLLGAVRYDEAKSRTITPAGVRTEKKDTATTFRVGALYTFDNGVAPYVSYSQSFTPIAGSNLSGVPWEPQMGKGMEAGVKWQPSGDTLVTAAIFDIRDTNRLTPHPTIPNERLQTGEVRSRGGEIEFQARVMEVWDVNANYSYVDAKVSKSNTAGEVGKPLASVPKHNISAWVNRRFEIGGGVLQLGAGARYFSKSTDRDLASTFILDTPSYFLMDAVASYEVNNWRFSVNANNLLDKYYYSSCLVRGDCFIGARRTVVASLGVKF